MEMTKASENLVTKLAPPYIQGLEAYQSARRIGGNGRYWLNANELACSPLAHLYPSELNRYPDFLPGQLADAYAQYAGVPNDYCIATRGADEAIELLVRCYSHSNGHPISICSPSYGMYQFCAQANQSEVRDIPLKADFSWDIDRLIAFSEQTSIIFICSPNNPSGNPIARTQLEQLLKHSQDHCLVVVDEAYLEFCPEQNLAELLNHYPNLILIRTLSKAFGLASLRVGFALASPVLLETVRKLIAPYPIPDPSALVGIQALSKLSIAQMSQATQELNAARKHFENQLTTISCVEKIYPSATNFILIKVKQKRLNQCFDFLRTKAIVTRNQSHEPSLQNCIRISIGTPDELDSVTRALEAFSQLEQ